MSLFLFALGLIFLSYSGIVLIDALHGEHTLSNSLLGGFFGVAGLVLEASGFFMFNPW
jgi:hypothetical protein